MIKLYMNKIKAHFSILLILLLTVGAFWGCKTKKLFTPREKVFKTADEVFSEVHIRHANYDWFSARFSGNALFDGSNLNIAGSIRIKKDSAIFVSITPVLGIEVARLLVTPDSVKFINRLESSYYIGDNKFINRMLGADIDFFMLQSLISGNDFPHFENDNFIMKNEKELIYLDNPRRIKSDNHLFSISQDLIINADNFRIRQNQITDTYGRMIKAIYSEWVELDEQLLPSILDLLFTDKTRHAEIFIKLNRMSINTPQNMSFRIPPRYEEIDL